MSLVAFGLNALQKILYRRKAEIGFEWPFRCSVDYMFVLLQLFQLNCSGDKIIQHGNDEDNDGDN